MSNKEPYLVCIEEDGVCVLSSDVLYPSARVALVDSRSKREFKVVEEFLMNCQDNPLTGFTEVNIKIRMKPEDVETDD